MSALIRYWVAVCACLCLTGAFVGCKRSADLAVTGDSEAAQAAQGLPGGTNVLAALDQKDYEGAVANLGKLQASVGAEQQDQLTILKQHVKNKLIEVSATDPKAAEALNTLRLMTLGR